MNIDQAKRHLKSLGIILTDAPGEFRLRYLHGSEEQIAEYLTEAIKLGEDMAAGEHPPPPAPRMGPLPKKTKASFISGHNIRLIKKRDKIARGNLEAQITLKLKREPVNEQE